MLKYLSHAFCTVGYIYSTWFFFFFFRSVGTPFLCYSAALTVQLPSRTKRIMDKKLTRCVEGIISRRYETQTEPLIQLRRR